MEERNISFGVVSGEFTALNCRMTDFLLGKVPSSAGWQEQPMKEHIFIKKDGYYYFFASIGTCCEGLKSTYTTVVGRSKKLFGPYVDKNGKKMLDNHHEILIHKNEAFVGTGHNSEIVTDKAGNDWVFYHAVSTKNPGGRVLMLDKVDWKDGWPSVSGNSPSSESERPVL